MYKQPAKSSPPATPIDIPAIAPPDNPDYTEGNRNVTNIRILVSPLNSPHNWKIMRANIEPMKRANHLCCKIEGKRH